MNCGQTHIIVDTPPKEKRHWPEVEDFQEREEISKWRDIQQVQEREEISKWRDIQQGMYKVSKTEDTTNTDVVVLRLDHENGPKMLVREPSSLAYAMQNRKHTDYILNLGMGRSYNNYYDFKLACIPEQQAKK